MNTKLILIILANLFALGACGGNADYKPDFGGDPIDSLLYHGANHFDIASWLERNGDLDTPVKPHEDCDYSIKTSANSRWKILSKLTLSWYT